MKSRLVQCRIFLSSGKKYRAWIELVLCTKCAECCDKTEVKDHECPFRILVTLFEGGQYPGRFQMRLADQIVPSAHGDYASANGHTTFAWGSSMAGGGMGLRSGPEFVASRGG